jgi:hypothetical protein
MNTVKAGERLCAIYARIFKNISKTVDNDRIYQKPSKRENDQFLSWKKILKIREKFRETWEAKKTFSSFYDYYIIALFTMIPPLRSQEFCSCLVCETANEEANEENIYCLDDKTLRISQHKTEKSLGSKIIKIPLELHKLIVKCGSKFLIPTKDKKRHQTIAGLSLYVKKLLGLSPSILRKIYISMLIDSEADAETRKKVAFIMGHSPSMQMLVYTKFAKSIHR